VVLTRRARLLPGRSSENGVGGGSGGASATAPSGTTGSGTSAAAMGAIVAALEGLTKEVGKVRLSKAESSPDRTLIGP
jgi:hypothetical protein